MLTPRLIWNVRSLPIARKGWLQADHTLNALAVDELLNFAKKSVQQYLAAAIQPNQARTVFLVLSHNAATLDVTAGLQVVELNKFEQHRADPKLPVPACKLPYQVLPLWVCKRAWAG